MQNNRTSVGPRGLAMITLVGGAVLASPFLRPPQVDLVENITQSPLAYPTSPGRLASPQPAAQHSAQPAAQLSSGSNDQHSASVANVPELFDTNNSSAQIVEPQFPAWAKPPSPIDHVISKGTAPSWHHQSDATSGQLQPLQSWVGGTANRVVMHPESQHEVRPLPSTQSPQEFVAAPPIMPTTTLREPTTAQAVIPPAIGSLAVASQAVPYQSPSNQTQPQPSIPATSKFVFQPGFGPQSAGPK